MPHRRVEPLPYPAIDWKTETRIGRRWKVLVQCPGCDNPHYVQVATAVAEVAAGTFTGRCMTHRQPSERKHRMERPPHPAVDWTPIVIDRHRKIRVTCPACHDVRIATAGPVSAKVRAGTFTGLCLPCSPNARKREWVILGPGRKLDPVKGYVRLSLEAVDPADIWLYDAMRERRSFILEHRMVMARVLGRPLTRNELVDHRDGIKIRNDPDNLRLYRRGKNDDGSGCGYGTFYDEWQRAEAEIRRLRALLGL